MTTKESSNMWACFHGAWGAAADGQYDKGAFKRLQLSIEKLELENAKLRTIATIHPAICSRAKLERVARRACRLWYVQGLVRCKTLILGATIGSLHRAYIKHLADGEDCVIEAPDLIGLIEAEIAEQNEDKT